MVVVYLCSCQEDFRLLALYCIVCREKRERERSLCTVVRQSFLFFVTFLNFDALQLTVTTSPWNTNNMNV